VFSTTIDLSFPPVLAPGDIVAVDLDSKTTTHLTSGGDNRWPTWSPDGRWIAFVSDRDEPHGELYIVRADGSDIRRLTSNAVAESMPDWSPN
jgi:Tol biopolymer transport system component